MLFLRNVSLARLSETVTILFVYQIPFFKIHAAYTFMCKLQLFKYDLRFQNQTYLPELNVWQSPIEVKTGVKLRKLHISPIQ